MKYEWETLSDTQKVEQLRAGMLAISQSLREIGQYFVVLGDAMGEVYGDLHDEVKRKAKAEAQFDDFVKGVKAANKASKASNG